MGSWRAGGRVKNGFDMRGSDILPALCAVPSFGCVFALLYLLVFQGASFPNPGHLLLLLQLQQAVAFAVSAAVSLVICRMAKKGGRLDGAAGQLAVTLAGPFLLVACWVIGLVSEALGDAAGILGTLQWLALGAAIPLQLYCSILPFRSIDQRHILSVVAGASLFGAVICFSAASLGRHGGMLLLAILDGWSAALSNLGFRDGKEVLRRPAPEDSGQHGPKTTYSRSFKAAVVLYAMIFGTMVPQTVVLDEGSWLIASTVSICAASLAVGVCAVLRQGAVSEIRKGLPQRAVAAFVVVGFLPLAIFGPVATWFCCLVIAGAFSLYLAIDLSSRIMMQVSDMEEAKALAVRHQVFTMLGLSIGIVVEVAVSLALGGEGVNPAPIVALGLTVILVLVVALTAPPDVLQGHSVSKRSEESPRWDVACDKIAARYHLTPREVEVLHLLSKRASTKTIQEKLVISPHTVESHIHNIYRKLGVNSKDETIALIEAAFDSQ